MPFPLVLAHAGLAGPAVTANTVSAFEAALAAGADGVELDVRRSEDGIILTHHDARVGGLPIRTTAFGRLQERARELGYEIPTLAAALDALPAPAVVDVELKEGGYEAEVLAVVRPRVAAERLLLTSFRVACLAALAPQAPGVRRGLLVGWPTATGAPMPRAAMQSFVERRRRRARARLIAPHWRLLERGGVPQGAADLVVWTVDEAAPLRRVLTDPRVAVVVTNRVALALELRAELATPTP